MEVAEIPCGGKKLSHLNTDKRFLQDAGFVKIEKSHKLPDDNIISIHYQYNSIKNKAYDMKVVTPKKCCPT